MTDQPMPDLEEARKVRRSGERRFYLRHFSGVLLYAVGALMALFVGPATSFSILPVIITTLVVAGLVGMTITGVITARSVGDTPSVEMVAFVKAAAASFCVIFIVALGYTALESYLSFPAVPTPVVGIGPPLLFTFFIGYFNAEHR